MIAYRQRGLGVDVNVVARNYALTLRREQGKAPVKRAAVLFWCVAVVVIACVVLSGCESHRGKHCVRQHTQCAPCTCFSINGMGIAGGGGEETVCDEWVKDVAD